MKLSLIYLLSLGIIGCAGVPKTAPQSAPVAAAPAIHTPTVEEIRAKIEQDALEADRKSAVSYAKATNLKITERMHLPQGVEVKEEVQGVVFADERAIVLVTIKVTFVLQNQIMDESIVTFFMVKDGPDSWDFRTLAARPTPEMVLRQLRRQQQSRPESEESGESNGTKL